MIHVAFAILAATRRRASATRDLLERYGPPDYEQELERCGLSVIEVSEFHCVTCATTGRRAGGGGSTRPGLAVRR